MPFTAVRWSFHCLPSLPFSGKSGAIPSHPPSVSSLRLNQHLLLLLLAIPPAEEVLAGGFYGLWHLNAAVERTRIRNLPAPDAHHRPALGAARQERLEGLRQVVEVDGSRDLVQVPRMEIAALCESAPQLAPRLDLKPVGIYTEEVYAP